MAPGLPRRVALACACLAACAAGAAELGTLFTTAEERARLDRLRRGEPAASTAGTVPARTSVVTGYVKRSDGRNTVWIDGVPLALSRPADAALLDPRAVDRPLPSDGVLRIERKAAR